MSSRPWLVGRRLWEWVTSDQRSQAICSWGRKALSAARIGRTKHPPRNPPCKHIANSNVMAETVCGWASLLQPRLRDIQRRTKRSARGRASGEAGHRTTSFRCGFQVLSPQAAMPSITAFTSYRTNLSPFTKGCREWDAAM